VGELTEPVPILGIAATPWVAESDAVLDELVFAATSAALREAGVRKHELGLAVQASMDVYDARSISSGLTTAAAGGYLSDSYRIQGDVGQAVVAAAQAVAAGDVEVAVAVGVYNPEVAVAGHAGFVEQVSNLAFDPHLDRPVGLTGTALLGMHAGRALDVGELTEDGLAELAAAEITRGAAGPHAVRRTPVTAADVRSSAPVHGVLRELMLPAASTGAIAVVLASRARARRALGHRGVLTGWGQGGGDLTSSGRWLTDPAASTRAAAARAYRRAGLHDQGGQADLVERVDLVELTAATPALLDPVAEALGLGKLPGDARNPSGGVRANFPGLANGGLRLLEAVRALESRGGPGRAVAHAVGLVSGPAGDAATVFVVEDR
jgi:acetyl-CoA acetyltransferase